MPETSPSHEKEHLIEQLKYEVIEMAGNRSLEESTQLLEDSLAKLRKERIKSEGAISDAKDIESIDRSRSRKKFSEGAVTFVPIENEAVIINTSDIHGSAEDLKGAVEEFIKRKEDGENVYFNFGGDIGSGDPQKIECNEMLASLALKYPESVTRESGNGDRRGASLLHGFAAEATEKFKPELFEALDEKVKDILYKYAEERDMEKEEIEKKIKRRGWEYNTVFGAQLLKAARLGGHEPMNPEEINPIYLQKITRGVLGIKEGEHLWALTANVLSPLYRGAPEAPSKTKEREKMFSNELHEDAKEVFKYWRLQNQIYNEQPTYVIFKGEDQLVIASHSGYVENVDKFGEVVHDPVKQGKGVWNRYGEKGGEPKVVKYGDFVDYNPEDYGKFWGKFAPDDKKLVLLVGHNHGNHSEEIDLLDSEGEKTGQKALRVEVCSGKPKVEQPKYLVLDTEKTKDDTQGALEFKDTK